MAALEARLLKQILRDQAVKAEPLDELAMTSFKKSLSLIEGTWSMSAVPDMVYPETRGERPPDFENQLRYNRALLQAAVRHPSVQQAFTEVQQLLKPSSILQDPHIDAFVRAELFQMVTE